MARQRKYTTDAERQAAYRVRKAGRIEHAIVTGAEHANPAMVEHAIVTQPDPAIVTGAIVTQCQPIEAADSALPGKEVPMYTNAKDNEVTTKSARQSEDDYIAWADFRLENYLPAGVYTAGQLRRAYIDASDEGTGGDHRVGTDFSRAFKALSADHAKFFDKMLRAKTFNLHTLGSIEVSYRSDVVELVEA